MDLKEKIKEKSDVSKVKRFGVFNIEGYTENGSAIGNKLALFDDENTTKKFCMFLLANFKNEESLKKIFVVDFEKDEEKSLLLYCFDSLKEA